MFHNLLEVNISINEYGIWKTILIDNNKKTVSLNGKDANIKPEHYNEFLATFFRIIRYWETEETEDDENTIINITIKETDKQYEYHLCHKLPDNYDSFLDLFSILF